MLERGGIVKTHVVENRKKYTLQQAVRNHVSAGSALYSDNLASYDGSNREYAHQTVNHTVRYVDGLVHTNGIENFWSLLKRCINGTWVSVEPFHLFRYLDGQTWRYNNRKLNDGGRFLTAVRGVIGRRLTYKKLTGKKRRRGPKAEIENRLILTTPLTRLWWAAFFAPC